MDAELYDEFGNYVGPDLDSDNDDDAEEAEQYVDDDEQQEYDVSLVTEPWRASHTTCKSWYPCYGALYMYRLACTAKREHYKVYTSHSKSFHKVPWYSISVWRIFA